MVIVIIVMIILFSFLKYHNQKGGESCSCNPTGDDRKRCPPEACKKPGLVLSYFATDRYGTKQRLFRKEVHNEEITYSWGGGNILNSDRKDNVRLEFEGLIKGPVTGEVEFKVQTDDGIRLFVDGRPIIDKWKLQGTTTYTARAIPLVKDEHHPFKLEWYEHGGGAVVNVFWRYSGRDWEAVPASAYFHHPSKTPKNKRGLVLRYYNTDRSGRRAGLFKTETHTNEINYNWGGGNVLNSGRRDNVRLEFEGLIQPPIDGPIQFRVQSDDGVKLTVDLHTLINKWKLQGPTYHSGRGLDMVKAKQYPIRLDWYEHGGGAVIRLQWKYPGRNWHTVPASAFYHVPQLLPNPPKPKFPSGPFTITARHSGKVLDVAGGSRNRGANVIQWQSHGGNNQKWIYEPSTQRIKSVHSNKCLDVAGGSKNNMANIIQWDCHNGPNQKWRYDDQNRIVAKHSGKCMDIGGGRKHNGANLLQYQCHGGQNQKFNLKKSKKQTKFNWRQIPGGLKNVSTRNNWTWGTNRHHHIYKCKSPCYKPGGSHWQRVPGGLKQIDVGPKDVWGVNSGDHIYRRPANGSGNWQRIGGKLKHVSVGPTGWVWGVNRNNDIFMCHPRGACRGGWRHIPGKLKQIDVGRDRVYGVNRHNHIYTRPVDGSGNWKRINGSLKHVTTNDKYVYGVNNSDSIYKCNYPCDDAKWKHMNGKLRYIDAGPREIVGTNSGNAIYSSTNI